MQYSLNKKHSFSTIFHYSTWAPDPSFTSENVISTNHLLSYTGNPALKPSKSYDIGAFYSWFPNNNVSFSAFATTW
ncbi:outer membrane beta-barrel protein, partial [Vibrio parahaemolyticus]|uniref:outer membrane beta-barrel protein n=1 Tax=Vibrio parahaemolyticus TaxID=670 RepID=UPI0034D2B210